VQPYINASPMLIGQEVEALCRCANIVSYDKDEKTDCSTCFLTLLQDCNISVVLVDGAKKNCVARKAKESLVDVTSIIFHSRCDCLVINKIDVERTLRGGKGRVTSTGYKYEVFVLNVSIFVQISCTLLVTFHLHKNITRPQYTGTRKKISY